MRKVVVMLLVAAAALIVSGLAFADHGGAPSAGAVQPLVIDGNPKCSDLNLASYEAAVKFDPPADGTKSGLTIDVDGKFVDWSLNVELVDAVHAVIVKGGPNANIYLYGVGWDGDEDLHAPVNHNNGKYYGLSHVDFCFDPKDF